MAGAVCDVARKGGRTDMASVGEILMLVWQLPARNRIAYGEETKSLMLPRLHT